MGDNDGDFDDMVGSNDGDCVGSKVSATVGSVERDSVGSNDGDCVGSKVSATVGSVERESVGCDVASIVDGSNESTTLGADD